jgi:hypothetical protein
LPQRIEAESADEIASALETVAPHPGAEHQPGSNIEASWHADAVASVDSCLLREQTV